MKTTQWTEALHLYEATIDGESVRGLHCFGADEETGFVECYFHPFLLDQDGRPRSYIRYGKVAITPPSPDRLQARALRLARLRLDVIENTFPT